MMHMQAGRLPVMHSLKTISWLKARHVRTGLNRLSHLAGADLLADTGLGERAYQLYISIFALVACALSWVALIDQVASIGAMLDPLAAAAFLHMGALIPLSVLLFLGVRCLRSSPLKLSAPDISFIASGPLSQSTLVVMSACEQAMAAAVCGGLGGYLLGVGLQAAAILVLPIGCAFTIGISCALAVVVAWVLGIFRLTLRKRSRRAFLIIAIIVLFIAINGAAAVMTFAFPTALITAFMLGSSGSIALAISIVACAGATVALSALSRNMDMTAAIEENWLYAELHPLRLMATYDSAGYEEIRRRKKLAARGPKGSLAFRDGSRALVTRAALSHFRQYEGLPSLAFWSFMLAPAGALLMLGAAHPVFLLPWVGIVIMMPGAACEMTRVFKADSRNRTIRAHLPYSPLWLLFFDSLPALLFAGITSSVVAAVFAVDFGLSPAWAPIFAVICTAAALLCGALDSIELPTARWQPSFAVGIVVFTVACSLLSLSASVTLVAFGAIVVLAVYAGMVSMSSS